MSDYPYLASNKNIGAVFEKIRTAAKPARFTISLMKQLGFTSSNDQSYPSLLKKLGFLTDDGTPTVYYDSLRDPSTAQIILADRIKELYSELFAINTEINGATDEEIKGAISRVTGKDAKDVGRIFTTFKTLCAIADFSGTITSVGHNRHEENNTESDSILSKPPSSSTEVAYTPIQNSKPDFHYNIQIHLPATTDISVYNAIFKSIKEHLL